jgi:elongation factor P hydroxylase
MGDIRIVVQLSESIQASETPLLDFVSTESLNVEQLIKVFNRLFYLTTNTKLVSGSSEPLYLPANSELSHHQIIFANGFFSSALHEISHWMVAGASRRKLEDYGYWYKPEGRTETEQREFEKVEVKPQAIEWILSEACGHVFHFSADNLNATASISDNFKKSVLQQAKSYINQDKLKNLSILIVALTQTFNRAHPSENDFGL